MNFVWYLVIGIILINIPVIRNYFQLVNTIIHEFGHVFGALITKSIPSRIKLNFNTGGSARTYSDSWSSKVIIAFLGYPTSSFVGLMFIYFLYIQKYEIIFLSLSFIIIISLLFFIRDLFSIIWSISLLTVMFFLNSLQNESIFIYFINLVVAIIVVESVNSAYQIAKLSFRNSDDAGDVTNLVKLTKIPSFIWGSIFLLQSLGFLGTGMKYWN